MTAIEVSPKAMKKLAEKKEKKEKRKRDGDRDDREDKRAKKRIEKEALLSQVPETDEHGISYSKLQRRRMMKRVKRGLPPVPTPEEEEERLRQEAQLKREEEEELAGMLYNKRKSYSDDEEEDQDDDDGGPDIEIENSQDENPEDEADIGEAQKRNEKSSDPEKKKRKRAKEVPVDYICQACKNKHQPVHWIYDCPDKVTIRGTNKVSKSTKGIHDPDEKKVFVSGLPFEAKRKDVEALFSSCGKLVQCKLLTFPDTGRCKGQAYLTFDSQESAKKAVALNGTTIDNKADDDKKPKGEKGNSRTELKLKVTKMLNRIATKKPGVR
jgi:RNA recognition motif. (a.k.a. RRM, RBD, or RNP domain)